MSRTPQRMDLIQEIENPEPPPRKGLTPKALVLTLAGVLIVAGSIAAGVLWYMDSLPPDPQTADQLAVATYLASEDFAKLDIDAQYDFYCKCELYGKLNVWNVRKEMGDEGMKKITQNLRPAQLKHALSKVDQFFSYPPAQQDQYLRRLVQMGYGQRWINELYRAYPELNPMGGTDSDYYGEPLDDETKEKIQKFRAALEMYMNAGRVQG